MNFSPPRQVRLSVLLGANAWCRGAPCGKSDKMFDRLRAQFMGKDECRVLVVGLDGYSTVPPAASPAGSAASMRVGRRLEGGAVCRVAMGASAASAPRATRQRPRRQQPPPRDSSEGGGEVAAR